MKSMGKLYKLISSDTIAKNCSFYFAFQHIGFKYPCGIRLWNDSDSRKSPRMEENIILSNIQKVLVWEFERNHIEARLFSDDWSVDLEMDGE